MIREMLVPGSRIVTESEEDKEKGEPGAHTETTHRVRQRVCREKPRRPVVVRVNFLSSTGYSLKIRTLLDIACCVLQSPLEPDNN